MRRRWRAIEAELAATYGILDVFGTFDGRPLGWRKFSTLLAFLPRGSVIWEGAPASERIVRAPTERTVPGRLSAEAWAALDAASGTLRPRGRVMTLDAFLATDRDPIVRVEKV